MSLTFGERFKELRMGKKLTQEELRIEFNNIYNYNFTTSAISQYENNKRMPEIDALKAFADYFNVSIDYLLGLTDFKEKPKKKPFSLFKGQKIEEDGSNYLNRKTIIQNIKLIMGARSTEEFSADIEKKTGFALLEPDVIKQYLNGDVIPQAGSLSVLADYAGVGLDFFYKKNSIESLDEEKLKLSNEQKAIAKDDFMRVYKKIKKNNINIETLEKIIDAIIEEKKS